MLPVVTGKKNYSSLILSMLPVPHNEVNVTVPSQKEQKTIFGAYSLNTPRPKWPFLNIPPLISISKIFYVIDGIHHVMYHYSL